MRRFAIALAMLALTAGPALAQRDFQPPRAPSAASRSVTLPIQTRLSVVKAANYVLTKICLPVAFERNTVENLAPYFSLDPVDPAEAGAQAGEKAYVLTSITKVYVIGAADGGCLVRTGRASPVELRKAAMAVLEAAPKAFTQRSSVEDGPDKMDLTLHCAADAAPPVAVSIATTHAGRYTPYGLEMRFTRAEGAQSGACNP